MSATVSSSLDWFWTSSGKAIAYRQADSLFSSAGAQIGHFRGDEIYGENGNYLGEVAASGRLVTQLSKLRWQKSGFFPTSGPPVVPPGDQTAEDIASGFKDFKVPRLTS